LHHKSRQKRRQKTSVAPPSQVAEYQVDAISHDARGISRKNGKVTFIAGALSNETVEAQVYKVNRRYDEAKLISIQEASSHRIEPACPHYEACGGCCFQHLAYPEQIAAKSHWLQGQLRKFIKEDSIEYLLDEPFHYRRRARLSVKVYKDHSVALGFRAKGSTDIVTLDTCLVLTESLQRLLPVLKKVLVECLQPRSIGHIELLEDDMGCSVLLRLTGVLTTNDALLWRKMAQENNLVLYLQEAKENTMVCDQDKLRTYQVEGITIRYHPQAFIQVNSRMNNKMVAQAIAWLELQPEDKVLDLFCGVGNFTLPIAAKVASVVGVEVQEQMVENARQNAILNRLENVTFIGADLTKPVKKEQLKQKFNKIVLDPPRAGAMDFLPSLIKMKAQTILYISCDAATLARDVEYLVSHDYRVIRVSMMEMFPQTSHVETMMLLQK